MALVSMDISTSGTYKNINLATDYDLTLRVIEYNYDDPRAQKVIQATVDFEVKRDLVSKEGFSKFLAKMLKPSGKFMEANQKMINIEEQFHRAVEPFLREAHDNHDHDVEGIDLTMVWMVIHTADYFGFDLDALKTWFHRWYFMKGQYLVGSKDSDSDLRPTRQMLYPAFVFDHAMAFNTATRYLVYHADGHITESTPVLQSKFHLPSVIIRMSNLAMMRIH